MADNAFLSAARYSDPPLDPAAADVQPGALNSLLDAWRSWRDGNAAATRGAWSQFTQGPESGWAVTPEMIGQAAGFAAPIRAYHGSPFDFPAEPGYPLGRFRDDKIGSGEGNQAYAYGHYSAGNENVARYYRDNLSKGYLFGALSPEENKLIPPWAAGQIKAAADKDYTVNSLIDDFEQRIADEPSKWPLQPWVAEENVAGLRAARDALVKLKQGGNFDATKNGRMYELELGTEPGQLLDWDKPLGEQPANVQAALGDHGIVPTTPGFRWSESPNLIQLHGTYNGVEVPQGWYLQRNKSGYWDIYRGGRYSGAFINEDISPDALAEWKAEAEQQAPKPYGDLNGGGAYKLLGRQLGKPGAFPNVMISQPWAASQALKDAGVPGVRYLDGSSRMAGDGSHNYVMFDPKIINILRKYALPGAVAGGGAAAGDDQ
jgi:hypothetical protein